MSDRDDDLWFGQAGGGLVHYDGERFAAHSIEEGMPHQQVQYLLEDDQRFLWAGTWGGGLTRYDGKHWTHFTIDQFPALEQARVLGNAGRVEAICIDARDHAWLCTWGGGLVRYDGQTLENFTRDRSFSTIRCGRPAATGRPPVVRHVHQRRRV